LITVHLQPEYVHSQLSELAVGCVPMIGRHVDKWEARAKRKYMKLNENHQQVLVSCCQLKKGM